jgi:glucuronokinase
VSRATAFARAALAGNPSDGYGGAVVAFAFSDCVAEVEVEPIRAPGVIVHQGPWIVCEPPDPDADRLLVAAGRRLAADTARLRLRWRTTIPRQLGMAGSSALVIATLRAVAAHTRTPISDEELPRLALAVETEDLGITAGLQDRVVQTMGGVVVMDFSAHRFERLDAPLPPLYVAWQQRPGDPSGSVHGDLRARFDRGDTAVVEAMAGLREAGLAAAAAIRASDHAALARAIDDTFDLRRRILDLDRAQVAAVEAARAAGASANFTGSGGAIAGTLPDAAALERVRAALPDWTVIAPTVC